MILMNRTSLLACKQKHMMKFGVLFRLLPLNSMVSQAELISNGYHSLVPGLISTFLETVWVPLRWGWGV